MTDAERNERERRRRDIIRMRAAILGKQTLLERQAEKYLTEEQKQIDRLYERQGK